MYPKIHAFLFFVLLFIQAQAQVGNEHIRSTTYQWPAEKSVRDKLTQWQDLKFGVLLHWGLYSIPGIVESWSICSEDEPWIPRDTSMTYDAYKKWYWGLINQFNPTDFNPRQWADIMKEAGMKYAIFTTKHHDGFCLFDTKQADFSSTHSAFKNNPKADIAKYVFDAFRSRGFMTGAYFSKPDWHCEYYWWPYFATPNRGVNYKINRHPERWAKFQQFTYNQIHELMTGYGPLDILWLDGGWVAAPRQDIRMDSIATMARKAQPGILIVDRTIPGKYENYQTPERAIPEKQILNPWESCITLSHDWGWTPNAPYKTSNEVINLLIEVVAKGGSLLLGVGPTPSGIIEKEAADRLRQVGAWLKRNGQAIYATRPTPFYQYNNVWFTADKDGKTRYALLALPDSASIPHELKWEGGNMPTGKMRLVATGKCVTYHIEGNRVSVTLPQEVIREGQPVALAFHVNPEIQP